MRLQYRTVVESVFVAAIALLDFSCRTQAVQNIERCIDDNGWPKLAELREGRALPSPDGRLALSCDTGQDDSGYPIHSLYVCNSANGQKEKVFEYCRSVWAVWAPDSQHFFLNWKNDPDEMTCLIFAPRLETNPVDLNAMLIDIAARDTWFENMQHEQCSIFGVQWNDKTSIDISIPGTLFNENGKWSKSFRLFLRYKLGDGFIKLGKKVRTPE